MTTGEKLLAIMNSEYLKFVQSMNQFNLDASLSLVVLESMKSRILEQIHRESLEEKVKEELSHGDE